MQIIEKIYEDVPAELQYEEHLFETVHRIDVTLDLVNYIIQKGQTNDNTAH